jgi:phage terminase small subunit
MEKLFMVKGRKPLASSVKRQSGAFKKNPQRENKHEPEAKTGHPSNPAHIASNPKASGYWDHACSQLAEMDLLTKADRSLLEVFSEAMAIRQQAFAELDMINWKKAADTCIRVSSELGLTPSARSRLVVKSKEEEDAFTQWSQGMVRTSDN